MTGLQSQREEITAHGVNAPIGHYVDAVRFGDLLFVSGCGPLDDDMQIVGDTAGQQARQVFANMERVLSAAGASFSGVLKVTVWLTDANDRDAVNSVRREFFGDARAASTLVEVRALAFPEMKVEVDAVVGLSADPQVP